MALTVIFRADSSFEIGSGHVTRCLTLAKALRARGAKCHFICRAHEGNLLQRIRAANFEVTALPHVSVAGKDDALPHSGLAHASWLGAEWQTDADQTIAALNGDTINWLVVDHYGIDKRWETQLRPYCDKIMVIDDLADREHDCDLLLDQNLVENVESRYDGLVPAHCARLLGPEYALLQPEYAELHPRTPPRLGPIKRILIFFGGSDPHNLTGLALSAFLSLQREDIALDVVISAQSPHAASIFSQAQGHANITVHDILPSLAPLMLKADLAIGASGATTWERFCLCLPSIIVSIAPNQVELSETLASTGLISYLGSVNNVSTATLAQEIEKHVNRHKINHLSADKMHRLVDGRGTERLIKKLFL